MQTAVSVAATSGLISASAFADVQFDGSMGAPGLAPTEVVQNRTVHVIDQARGTTNGALLFHSVDRFQVPSSESAVMRGSAAIEAVIMRQTGPAPLTLEGGFISELPNADILMVSPSGVVTGPGTSIDVPGSFYLSGAESVHFEDGYVFDATGSTPAGLLTAAPPAAFGFGPASGSVTLGASDAGAIAVGPGGRLSFTGTQVIASGGNTSTANLGDPGSDVQIGAAEAGLLPLDLASLDPAQLPAGTELGRVATIGRYGIDVSTGAAGSGDADTPAGRVVIRGSQLFVQGSSSIRSAHQTSGDALGAIDIAASEKITVQQGASIESRSSNGTGGAGADILLTAPEISVTGAETGIEVASEGSGRSGHLIARADVLEVQSGASLSSTTTADAFGLGGALDLQANESIGVSGGGRVSATTRAAAQGGDVLMSAPGIEIDGVGSEVTVATEGVGHAGQIDFDAETIRIANAAQVSSKTTAASLGLGGGLELRASDQVEVARGGQLVSLAEGSGTGGSIEIVETGEVRVLDEGRIRSETSQDGAGGRVHVAAGSVTVQVDPSLQEPEPTDISTETTSASAMGRGGDLTIEADDVMLIDGGQITVRTSGGAASGDLTLDLGAGSLTVLGTDASGRPSGLFARAAASSLPVTGAQNTRLEITAGEVELRDGAEISASTFSDAPGPAIVLNVEGDLQVGRSGERAALVSSSSLGPGSQGAAGSITATATNVRLEGGGEIITDTVGGGDAGAISVTADDVEIRGVDVLGARSRISSESKSTALSTGGNAGAIHVDADSTISIADEGVVSVASAGIGGGGSILLEAGDRIRLSSQALISAEAAGSSDAGRVTLIAGERIEAVDSNIVTRAAVAGGGQVVVEASELIHLIRSNIDAQVNAGGGNGGDIEIDPRLVVLNDSDLFANAIDGNGGNILIVANQLLSSKDSDRFFTSQFGLDGSEVVTAPQSEVPSNLASIQQSVIDASDLMAERCDLRSERSGSFTIVSGVAARPAGDDVLSPAWLEEDGAPAMCEAPNAARSRE